MTVKIYVIRHRNAIFKMRIVDIRSGKVIRTETTGLRSRRDAERRAAERESELNRCTSVHGNDLTWDSACMLYDTQVLRHQSVGYRKQFASATKKIQELTDVLSLDEINQGWVSAAIPKILDVMESRSSAASYCRNLRAFLRWLAEQQYIQPVRVRLPAVDDIEAARGEPVPEAHYRKILEAAPLVVEAARAASVQAFIEGLWLSGFRLDELYRLGWDESATIYVKSLDADPPLIAFRKQKGKRAELWPIPPDWHAQLSRMHDRTGWVYSPLTGRLNRYATSSSIGKLIKDISERAGVTVTAGDGRRRWATANDLRRSFVQRWYEITGDLYLAQRMARHKTDVVTKRFYSREQASHLHARILAAYSKER